MKLEQKNLVKLGLGIFLIYLGIYYWGAIAGIISTIFGAAMPILIGIVIAYFVNILMCFYERHFFIKSKVKVIKAIRRPFSMLIAYLTIIALITLVIGLVLPQLISCVQLIIAEVPKALNYWVMQAAERNIISDSIANTLASIDWQSKIGGIINVLTSGVTNVMNIAVKAVTSVVSVFITTFLSIIFSCYLLLSKDKLKAQSDRFLKRYLKEKWYVKTKYVLGVLNECFHNFIVGQCIEAVILGVLCTMGMTLLKLPYATMIGALVAFTALIPVAGSYIGAVMGAFMILLVSPIEALIFLVFLIVLQQLEGNLIYPRVVGSSIGLPPLWVLAAVTIGGGILGVMGMLLGVPLAAAAYRLIREDVNNISPLRNK